MRLKNHSNVWAVIGGRSRAAHFHGYVGGGMVKVMTVDGDRYVVPRKMVKSRTRKSNAEA